jgi:hypothetical protein
VECTADHGAVLGAEFFVHGLFGGGLDVEGWGAGEAFAAAGF